MNKEIEIPKGYEARIEGNKVILELKESEDERIRKMLIEQMERWKKCAEANNVEQDVNDATSAIAYLERQKEQKPIFRVGDYVRNIKTGDKVLIEQLDIATKIYCYVSNDGDAEIHSDFPFSKQDEWEVIGQQVGQKPAEWSEGDEGMLNCIIATLCEESHGGREANDKMVTWLVNRLKFLRPSWKPSEEQMKALKYVAYHLMPDDNYRDEMFLLYEQLKKL